MSASRFLATWGVAALIVSGSSAATTQHKGTAASAAPRRAAPSPPLVSDPAVRYGRLANGMRYALRHNATPATGASFLLRIGAGSLNEQDDQRGLAHFIEHMVFNGSRHVPEGEYAQMLERYGLAFGADVNAYTTQDETVYMLELPETDAKVVDTALLLFRELAGETTMADDAIDRERGVVLSEERARSSPSFRAQVAQLDFSARGQLLTRRLPIGDVDIIRKAKRDRFLRFYHAYYRPENAIFVAVGNFDPAAMEAKLKARFGDWRGVGPAGAKPKLGAVAPRVAEAEIFTESGAPSGLELSWNDAPDLTPDSSAKRRKDMIEQLGLNVFNRRLAKLAVTDYPPFTSASASHSTLLKSLSRMEIEARFEAGKWSAALTTVEQERRRLVDYGITQRELDREITELRQQLRSGVAGETTRSSSSLASQILGAMAQDKAFTTPVDALARFDGYTRGLDAAQVNGVLKTLFRGQGPLLHLTGPEPIAGGNAAVLEAYEAASKLAVAAPPVVAYKPWSYTSFGQPGHVVERTRIADLGVTFVRFDNGVRLTVRPSATTRNSIQVGVRIGGGLRDLPKDKPSPGWIIQPGLIEGGLGRLTAAEIDDALVGKQYGAGVGIGENAFVLSGRTQPDDLATQMQVLAAYVTDPAFRPDGVVRMKAHAAEQDQQRQTSSSGVLSFELIKLLHPGDRRFGLPPLQDRLAMGIDDVRATLAPLKTGPIEVVMVGDVTVEDAIRRTAETFGALPPRPQAPLLPSPPRMSLPDPAAQPITLVHLGRKDQGTALALWPTNDYFADYQETLAIGVMTSVLELRLLDEFREKQGLTYSPKTLRDSSKVFPGFGYTAASVEVPADKSGAFFAGMAAIARSLRETPPSQDEFDRAVRPALESSRQYRETNDYWAQALAGAQTDPRRIEVIRQMIPGIQRVTPADVQRVAAKYLRDAAEWRVVVAPAGQNMPPK
ncbi:M16 family metallopeptidase [Sphingomonas bacterium]|uniref:M16 family metallopeptidase n=1 Tax=Sphingomonas bacterium TaxID=1895847 RepID=UPI001576D64B|nr:M16 family metallopeptidase [Sphingomonas bacterium]